MDAAPSPHGTSPRAVRRFRQRYWIPVIGALVMGAVVASRVDLLLRVHQLALRRAAKTAELSSRTLALELDGAVNQADRLLLAELLRLPRTGPPPRDRTASPQGPGTPTGGTSGTPPIHGVLIFDPEGRLTRGVSTLDRETAGAIGVWVRSARRPVSGGDADIAAVAARGKGAPPLLAVTRSVTSADGAARGFVAAAVDLREVVRRHAPDSLGADSVLLILSNDGRVLAQWPEREGASIPPGGASGLARGLPDSGQAVTLDAAPWSDGTERIASIRAIAAAPLVVVTGVSRRAALEPWRVEFSRVAILLPLLLGVGSAGIWIALRQIRLRDEAMAAIARAERELRQIVDGSIQGLIVHRGGKPIFANQRAAEILGYADPSELTAIDSLDAIIAPEELERMHRMRLARGLGDAVPEGYEFHGVRRDGAPFWAETRVRLVEWEGQPATLATLFDVTQRRLAEMGLQESERRFKDFTEASSDWFWEMDADLRYTAVVGGAYAERIQEPSEVIGKTVLEVRFPPEDRPAREDILRLMQHRQPVRDKLMVTPGRDGRIKTIRYSGLPVFGPAGDFQGYRGTGADISEEMEVRRRADLAHARLRDAIAALPAAFMLWDAEERLILSNDRVRDLFPDSPQWLRPGMRFEEYVRRAAAFWASSAPEELEPFIERRIGIFRHPPTFLELQRNDGRWLHIHEQRTSEGGTVSIQFDVTETKQREAELRQAQKMEALGQLTGGVAHYFNNLMQVILGYAELGLRAAEPAAAVAGYFAHIRGAGQRAAELTSHLLAFSRKQVLRPAPVNLNDLIATQARVLARMLGERVRLEVRPLEGLEDAVADRAMMEQVILNLASNARDAMPRGGTIVLSTDRAELDEAFCRDHAWARPGRYAVLRCTDTGEGMTREVRERLYEPFFTTKEPGQGTGLGLAMVYGIVRQHDGLVSVESEVGQGATFTIYLPLPISHDPHSRPIPR